MHRIEAYIRLGIIFILGISILYLPILFFLKKKGKSVTRQLSYIGLFCSLFLIIFATILFVPITFHPDTYLLNVQPFQWIGNMDSFQQFVVEKIPNILLFIPLGFFLPVVFQGKRRFYQTIFLSFGLTFGVEFFQYFIGRSADIDDIIMNLLGAILGYVLFQFGHYLFQKQMWWKQFLGSV